MSFRNHSPSHDKIHSEKDNSFIKMMSSTLRLSVVAVLLLVYTAEAVPVPDTAVEDFDDDTTLAPPKPPAKSPRVPKIDEKDLDVDEDSDEDDYEDPDYMTWEDLGRIIYSWAKVFAEPKQLKPLRKCLTGNAPKDAAQLIKRVESCVRIVDPEFSLRKFASLLLGSDSGYF